MKNLILILFLILPLYAVDITVDASSGRKPISPYIFGKNNSLSDNPSNPVSAADWELYRQAGLKMLRESGGNNSTKYNWRKKLSSHPDWYNNVYAHDWDFEAQSLQENLPGSRGMWAFQLIGYAASNTQNNFNDWAYNNSQWWTGVNQNLAGGGVVNEAGGSEALVDGDPELYLEEWPADSTIGILGKWFGQDGLNLDQDMFSYWNMDNESEIWFGTHDDVMPEQISAEEYMQRYFKVAKKARAEFPDIKLVGPVPANEWQWYNWDNAKISYEGGSYTWLEYFIMRIGEEQQASGIRLLDVLDVHFYPSETNADDIVQLHRVWFDRNYDYPGANGVKRTGTGSWDNSITKEYLFGRCGDWLEEYLGPDHGVTFGVTETGLQTDNPDAIAVWYASNLGTFADNDVEIFTPWEWENEMWEVLHLFSRYSKDIRVASSSDLDDYVSAYSSVSSGLDSLTIFLVNRSVNESQDVNVNINSFTISDGDYDSFQLDNPTGEMTFVSHTQNALSKGSVNVSDNSFGITLPSLSVTAVILKGEGIPSAIHYPPDKYTFGLKNYPNPFNPVTHIEYRLPERTRVKIRIYDMLGKAVTTLVDGIENKGMHSIDWNAGNSSSGVYIMQMNSGNRVEKRKIVLLR